MCKLLVAVCIAATAFVQAQSAEKTGTRDLSNMFYTDTLPPRPEPPPAKVEEVKKKPAVKPIAERRVGAKIGILYRTPDCEIEEVDPSTVFHSGDRIRLQVEANVDAYLYVLQKGSSGRDNILFPTPEINGGDNHVRRGVRYRVPAKGWFTFDENPGEEHVTVVVSKAPLRTMPVLAKSQQPDKGSVSIVSVVDELNQSVRSRDLVFFKEEGPVVKPAPAQPAPAHPIAAPAQSLIVVNTSQNNNNAVYKEIILKHLK